MIWIPSWRRCSHNATCDHPMHKSFDQWFDLILVHQSDLYFTSEFGIFSGFRVTVISRRARTSFLITVLKEWWLTRSPFRAWHYLALTLTYQPEVLPASPNQDISLRLTCNSLDGFPSSIYDYGQSFINYKDLWLLSCVW
jgi:hypothetical protein